MRKIPPEDISRRCRRCRLVVLSTRAATDRAQSVLCRDTQQQQLVLKVNFCREMRCKTLHTTLRHSDSGTADPCGVAHVSLSLFRFRGAKMAQNIVVMLTCCRRTANAATKGLKLKQCRKGTSSLWMCVLRGRSATLRTARAVESCSSSRNNGLLLLLLHYLLRFIVWWRRNSYNMIHHTENQVYVVAARGVCSSHGLSRFFRVHFANKQAPEHFTPWYAGSSGAPVFVLLPK